DECYDKVPGGCTEQSWKSTAAKGALYSTPGGALWQWLVPPSACDKCNFAAAGEILSYWVTRSCNCETFDCKCELSQCYLTCPEPSQSRHTCAQDCYALSNEANCAQGGGGQGAGGESGVGGDNGAGGDGIGGDGIGGDGIGGDGTGTGVCGDGTCDADED